MLNANKCGTACSVTPSQPPRHPRPAPRKSPLGAKVESEMLTGDRQSLQQLPTFLRHEFYPYVFQDIIYSIDIHFAPFGKK